MRPSSPASALASSSSDRRLPTPLVPHPENEARVTTEANGLLGAGLVQGQRFFAKDVLSCRDGSLDLCAMQRMRRSQHDRFHRGVRQRIRVIGRQLYAFVGAKRPHRFEVRFDGAHHADVLRRRSEHVEHFLAPPAHANEGNSYGAAHIRLSSRLLKGRIETVGQDTFRRLGRCPQQTNGAHNLLFPLRRLSDERNSASSFGVLLSACCW